MMPRATRAATAKAKNLPLSVEDGHEKEMLSKFQSASQTAKRGLNPRKPAAPKNAPADKEAPTPEDRNAKALEHRRFGAETASNEANVGKKRRRAESQAPAGPEKKAQRPTKGIKDAPAKTQPKKQKASHAAVKKKTVPTDANDFAANEAPEKKPRKKKANPYGLTPGVSPFPDWPNPTAQECHEVNSLLASLHGEVKAPAAIPVASRTVAGCGEVPCVLDALIRTYLSTATAGVNSNRSFQGLLDEFKEQKVGIGKGSVNWDEVRRSDVSRCFHAIRSGGLADVKSKNIKKILDMVFEENREMRRAGERKKKDSAPAENDQGKAVEIVKLELDSADEEILTLDHLHTLPTEEAFNHLLRYPGIGVKTASCVTMFCLRRPSFAVDTHVFRLCKWLGWVPETATRDTTFMHCEVRVPDELKYSLHKLLIMHGRRCGRCRAITGESSEGWEKGCVIDHLVKRSGKRKGNGVVGKKGTTKRTKRKTKDESEDSDESEEYDESASG
ncbi:MAG: hypothetical protein LQ351_001984 [Letrouitia transgressa]|nr:MAG: hypothetical protein LQ351_001984 [Letrouitia transgressa]